MATIGVGNSALFWLDICRVQGMLSGAISAKSRYKATIQPTFIYGSF